MNTTDEDIEKYLKIFTLLDFDVVAGIVKNHTQNPELRYGQKQLANYLITTVYGEEAAAQSVKISEILFGQGDKLETIKTMSKDDLQALQKETGGCEISEPESKIIDLFTQS
jgi:tyrosyl-tRNA synthetase